MTIIRSADFNVVITGAGDGDYIEMVIQEIHDCLMRIPKGGTIQKTIKDTVLRIFKDHFVPYATFPDRDRPETEFLCGIQSEGVTSLYKSRGTIFRRMSVPECIGIGLAVGKSLIHQLFRTNLPLHQAGLVALYILHHAKTWVDGCGGNSDIILLSNKNLNWNRVPTHEVKELEKHFDDFAEAMRPILIAVADRQLPYESFDAEMKKFAKEMFALRTKFMSFEEFWKRMEEVFGVKLTPLPEGS
jgi:hypothetical protein